MSSISVHINKQKGLAVIFLVVLKVILLATFSSEYQTNWFIPFATKFVEGENPYTYFSGALPALSYPFPPLMLLIESLGAAVLFFLPGLPVVFQNLFFKLPLLFADFMVFYFLLCIAPGKFKYIFVLYFASPIILYSTYMHSQLDIIPTAFLIAALYFLTSTNKNKELFYILLFTAALACKLHILAALPPIFLYSWKKDGLKQSLQRVFYPIFLFCILVAPFFSPGFVDMVFLNKEQLVLTQVYISIVNVKMYIPIIALLLIFLNMYAINSINKELLFSFIGITFTVFLILAPPFPARFVWIVPFIALFFSFNYESKYKNLYIYLAILIVYLCYFIFAFQSDFTELIFIHTPLNFFRLNIPILTNFLYTILSGLLLYFIFIMYQFGVQSNSFYKRKHLPFVIGISGDSASGKSSLIDTLCKMLGTKRLLFIEGDGDHRWERGEEEWKSVTHLNPKANYLHRQAEDINKLRRGDSINRVNYVHETGKFSSSYKIKPKPYIIICGLHAFYLPKMRKAIDLKIFMNTEETLRQHWKLFRDSSKRGYEKSIILQQIAAREADAQKYIHPQRELADLVIEYFDPTLTDCLKENHELRLCIKLTLSADIDLEPLVDELHKHGVLANYEFSEDLHKQVIVFRSENMTFAPLPIMEIGEKLIPQFDELALERQLSNLGLDAILILILFTVMSNKMQSSTC